MSIDYGFTIYYYLLEEDSDPLSNFYRRLERSLSMQATHTMKTTELYEKEQKLLREAAETAFRKKEAELTPAYRREYESLSAEDPVAHDYAMRISGLEDLTGNHATEQQVLQEQFEEMKDYFNKAALVSLYALLENELRKLCELLQVTYGKRVGIEHLNDSNYLTTCFNYLELVIELPIIKLKQDYETGLHQIQSLRNKIVHNGGEFSKNDPKLLNIKNIVAQSEKLLSLESERERFKLRMYDIHYVNRLYPMIGNFFQELFWLIDSASDYRLLSSRLTGIFKFINKDITATVTKVVLGNNIGTISFDVKSVSPENALAFQGKISYTRAKENTIEITNQLTANEQISRWTNQIKDRPEILRQQLFSGFAMGKEYLDIKVMLY
ncbi:hypothetical protein [Mucilaginibacter aquaedulcis]|uniref:hypothetical protein n=1 Tax=Mucilaginibacter aquaedulcis TaxID=1187081 RepID=UPI0025B464FC|nr:hypothetical protein [Mucilaginibacter aquaedulcis]MDN3548924.1 hypothetical protein [Mucilaginibacter aquaedulcis]